MVFFVVSFTGNERKTFCTMNGIKHITTAPNHSSSNGPAEGVVQMFKFSMKKYCEIKNSELITSINRFYCLSEVSGIIPHCYQLNYNSIRKKRLA